MPNREREAGRRWVLETAHQDSRVHSLQLGCEWGPAWKHVPRSSPAAPQTDASMLIISNDQARKVVWLRDEDLRSAGRADGAQAGAQRRLRDRVGLAIDEIASQLLTRSES